MKESEFRNVYRHFVFICLPNSFILLCYLLLIYLCIHVTLLHRFCWPKLLLVREKSSFTHMQQKCEIMENVEIPLLQLLKFSSCFCAHYRFMQRSFEFIKWNRVYNTWIREYINRKILKFGVMNIKKIHEN